MEKSIWKFILKTTDYQRISMPKNAEILTIQNQNESPCIWALVDTHASMQHREFEIYGTGHPFAENFSDDNRKYIGTYQLSGGALVFHCFEVTFK